MRVEVHRAHHTHRRATACRAKAEQVWGAALRDVEAAWQAGLQKRFLSKGLEAEENLGLVGKVTVWRQN